MHSLSVERALPYTDNLDEIQQASAVAFNGLVTQLQAEGRPYTTTLLVDDVTNSANVDFDLEVYEAASRVGDSTLVMRESEIQSVANEFYQSLSETLSPEELARLNTPDGFSSSYYIAVWTLMRLGRLRHPDFPEEQISTHIINVLPETWRKGEEESLSIIRQSPFSDAAQEVEYVWF